MKFKNLFAIILLGIFLGCPTPEDPVDEPVEEPVEEPVIIPELLIVANLIPGTTGFDFSTTLTYDPGTAGATGVADATVTINSVSIPTTGVVGQYSKNLTLSAGDTVTLVVTTEHHSVTKSLVIPAIIDINEDSGSGSNTELALDPGISNDLTWSLITGLSEIEFFIDINSTRAKVSDYSDIIAGTAVTYTIPTQTFEDPFDVDTKLVIKTRNSGLMTGENINNTSKLIIDNELNITITALGGF